MGEVSLRYGERIPTAVSRWQGPARRTDRQVRRQARHASSGKGRPRLSRGKPCADMDLSRGQGRQDQTGNDRSRRCPRRSRENVQRPGKLGQSSDNVQRSAAGQYRGDHGLDDGASLRAKPDRRRIFLERPTRGTRVLKDSRTKGVRTDAKVICSQQAHYVQQNSSDWTGLGMDNIVRVKTDVATNGMDLVDLERVLKDLAAKKIPVATVVCTMGTTDSSAFDPIGKVRELMDRYPNPPEYGKAILYADAVVGWSWVYFKDYDFAKNPLGFSERILPILKRNGQAMAEIVHADAIGIDFHKVGFAPYVSSCFLYKDAAAFEALHRRGADAYLQVRTPYNPMYYTLEVSRTTSGALAGWATLKYFGMEGMQAILGGILETKYYLYDLIDEQPDMVCVNPEDTGLITLYRVYPKGTNAKAQFQKELTDPAGRADLIRNNILTEAVGNKLFEWFRAGKKIDGKYTPWMSFSTGFRVAEYNRDEKDSEEVVFALKSFPMNVFVTPEIMTWTVHCVHAARDEVLKDQVPKAA